MEERRPRTHLPPWLVFDMHVEGPTPVRVVLVGAILAASIVGLLLPPELFLLHLAKDNDAIRAGEW